MNNDLLKLIQDTKDSMINGFSKISDNPMYENVLCGVEITFDKILKIVRFYDDVINGKWIKFSDACPEDFNLDWVHVRFIEKSGFVGLQYIAKFDKSKNIWRLQGQENDNTYETHYINNNCTPSSWKIIENSSERENRLALESPEGMYENESDSEIDNSTKITVGCKIRSKTNPDEILRIISDDCHGDEFECSNGSVLSLKQINKYYDLYIEENKGTIIIN